MKRTLLVLIVATYLLSLTTASSAAPEDDAIAQYRAYVAAVRAGKPEEVVKLIEPVPATYSVSTKSFENAGWATSVAWGARTISA